MEQTGLEDFGPDDFVERLEILCRALRTEGRLNDAGVMAQHMLLTGLLRNRLLVEDLVRGIPRSSTSRSRPPSSSAGCPAPAPRISTT